MESQIEQPVTSTQSQPDLVITNPSPSIKKSRFTIILIAIFLLLLVALSFLYYQNQQLKKVFLNDKQGQSTWKTYTDTKYNYEINYPSEGWSLERGSLDQNSLFFDEIVIRGTEGEIRIDPTKGQSITEPITDWIEASNKQLLDDPKRHPASSPMQIIPYNNELNITETPIVVNDDFFGRIGKSYIFKHNGNIFLIQGIYYISEETLEQTKMSTDTNGLRSQMINQILASFKFTDEKPTIKNLPTVQPTAIISITNSIEPTNSPKPIVTSTPTPIPTPTRTPSPPIINISFPQEGAVVTLSSSTICVIDLPSGGDTSGISRRQNINNQGWTEYASMTSLCFNAFAGPNSFMVQYRNSHSEESQIYTRSFLYQP